MFENMSIKKKVILLVLFPTIFLLLFSINSISNDYKNVKLIDDLKNSVKLSIKITALVHELQKDRGASCFLYQKTSKSRDI
jgi:methyl-accepting chemotaxis protein